MKRTLVTAVTGAALALPLALVTSGTAAAAQPADPGKGGRCAAAGTTVLASNGLMSMAAKGTLDYSAFAGDEGIRLPLTSPTYLPLKDVIALHRTSPELFAWCDGV